jgi:hypothetical protein
MIGCNPAYTPMEKKLKLSLWMFYHR